MGLAPYRETPVGKPQGPQEPSGTSPQQRVARVIPGPSPRRNSALERPPEMDALSRDRTLIGVAGAELEAVKRPTREEAMEAVRTLIAWSGDDPRREGVIDTPKRVVDAYEEWFAGYLEDPSKELDRTFEDVQGYDE